MKKDYYEILEVSKNASDEIIEKAYKILVKRYHPDIQKQEDKKMAEEKIKEINEAYEILSNPNKRNLYDEKIKVQNTYNISKPIIREPITSKTIIRKPIKYTKEMQKQIFIKKIKSTTQNFIALILTLIILWIIFQIPVIKNYFLKIYDENLAIKMIVDIFKIE